MLPAAAGLVMAGLAAVVPNALGGDGSQSQARSSIAAAAENYGRLQTSFTPNQGQAPEEVDFLARGNGYSLALGPTRVVLGLSKPLAGQDGSPATPEQATVTMSLLGASQEARPMGQDPLPGSVNYLVGNDPSKWRTGVRTFGRVGYAGVYPGVDAMYYGKQGHLEYDLVVAPGADPGAIALGFDGVRSVRLDDGDLVLSTSAGDVRQRPPVVYQPVGATRAAVEGRYVLSGARQIGFEVGPYDRGLPLVIDPALMYSTYLGGSDFESNPGSGTQGPDGGIAVDAAGNAYVTGRTHSADFPTTPGAPQPSFGSGRYAFVTKFDPAGQLVYSTYLGGGDEGGAAIAVDPSGRATVTGFTGSPGFPTTPGAFDATLNGYDMFLTRLNAAGTALDYSTYLGGSREDAIGAQSNGVAVDGAGYIYVSGSTKSADNPIVGGYQPVCGSCGPFPDTDMFMAKLDPARAGDGSGAVSPTNQQIVYSTSVGGDNNDANGGGGLAVYGSTGRAYLTGSTTSSDFPTSAGAFQGAGGGAYAVVLDTTTTGAASRLYATLLGGGAGQAIAVDTAGNAYIGGTSGPGFPTSAGAFQPAPLGGSDAFVFKLDPTASGAASRVYATFVGGSGSDRGQAISVDSQGNAFVAGATSSADFPTVGPLAGQGPGDEAFVTKLDAAGAAATFSTYLGSAESGDVARGIAVDAIGNIHVTGLTGSGYPTTPGAFDGTANGNGDAFVTTITLRDLLALTTTDPTELVEVQTPFTYTLTVTNDGTLGPATGVTLVDVLPPTVTVGSVTTTQGSCSHGGGTVTCALGGVGTGVSATVTITVTPTATGTITNTTTVAANEADPGVSTNSVSIVTRVTAKGCGRVITKDTTLKADLGPCAGDGIVVGADNITLNLNGRRVFGFPGPEDGNAAGIRLPGRHGVTVVGGKAGARVSDFDAGVVLNGGSGNAVKNLSVRDNIGPPSVDSFLGDGIIIFNSANNVLYGNTVVHNGIYDGIGILGPDSHDNLVQANVVTDNGTGDARGPAPGQGIVVDSFLDETTGLLVHGNNIIANTVLRNASSGISNVNVQDAVVQDNVVEDNGLEGSPRVGIGVTFGRFPLSLDTRMVIKGNRVRGDVQFGIQVRGNQNRVLDNIVDGSQQRGIFLAEESGNVVMRNTVTNSGQIGILALRGSGHRIERNTVTGSQLDGIRVIGSNTNHQIVRNWSTDNGALNPLSSFDLRDSSGPGPCGTNLWDGNTYVTANPTCTTAGGQQVSPGTTPRLGAAAASDASDAVMAELAEADEPQPLVRRSPKG